MYTLKKMIIACMYSGALGLAGHGWLSDVLPVSQKMLLTGVAVSMIGVGFALQWKWRVAIDKGEGRQ